MRWFEAIRAVHRKNLLVNTNVNASTKGYVRLLLEQLRSVSFRAQSWRAWHRRSLWHRCSRYALYTIVIAWKALHEQEHHFVHQNYLQVLYEHRFVFNGTYLCASSIKWRNYGTWCFFFLPPLKAWPTLADFRIKPQSVDWLRFPKIIIFKTNKIK